MTYSEIKAEIKAAPMTYLPGLLVEVVKTLTTKKVLKPGGAARIAQSTEDEVNGEPERAASGSQQRACSVDWVKNTLSLLQEIEWSGCVSTETMTVQTCPCCYNWKPESGDVDFWKGREARRGHTHDCKLNRLLQSPPNDIPR